MNSMHPSIRRLKIISFCVILIAHLQALTASDRLQYAISYSDSVKISKLLTTYPNLVHKKDEFGETPLHWASAQGRLLAVKLLIKQGARLDARSDDGETPLLKSTAGGSLPVLRFLIAKGADIHDRNIEGAGALSIACQDGNLDIARFLLEHGADPNEKDNNLATPLDRAAAYSNSLVLVKLLLSNGANLFLKDRSGDTCLHYAALGGSDTSVDIVRFLRAKNLNVNTRNSSGETALSVAAERDLEVARALVIAGSNVNNQGNSGLTPLHLAAQKGLIDTVKLLLHNGADVDIKTKNGETAEDLARDHGWSAIAKLLHGFKARKTRQ